MLERSARRSGVFRAAARLAACAALTAAAAWAQPADEWIIETVAGGSFARDGGPAVRAWLRFPNGAAADGSGNLYIADTIHHRIRKVDAAGNISTVAGNGRGGYSGDGGPAVRAQLAEPWGAAADGAGNLYIADTGNNRIRKVDAAGVISTVAGNGEWGYGGDGGPAVRARLASPLDAAADGMGNLYIADAWNNRIRKIDAAGNISTVAGSGRYGYGGDGGSAVRAQLAEPWGAAMDDMGNLYIADRGNNRIRKVDAAGVISTVAGSGGWGYGGDGGPALQARFLAPSGVAADAAGNFYIADTENNRIRKVDAAGVISTVAGTGKQGYGGDGGAALRAQLAFPLGAAADGAGNLYVVDAGNNRIRKVDAAGAISTVAGTGEVGDGGPAVRAWLGFPGSVAADGAGNFYIADTFNERIRKVDAAGVISTIAGSGERGYGGDGGPAAQARLASPLSAAADGAGNLYFVDAGNHCVRKVDAAGAVSTVAGSGRYGYGGDGGAAVRAQLALPRGAALDAAGNLYIADTENHRVRKVDAAGVISTVAGTGKQGYSGDGGAAVRAQLAFPWGVAADGAGNLYIADRNNHRIRKVDAAGVVSTVAGSGQWGYGGDGGAAVRAQLAFPYNAAADEAGNLYIADTWNDRIRKVDAAGVISTIAGSGEMGYSGDGGAAVRARLSYPEDVAADRAGNIYVADSGNNSIRRLRRIRRLGN